MISRFFRAFFWGILVASVVSWFYLGSITASAREAILVEDYAYGLDPDPIGPGEFRFLPARAFPSRVRLHPVFVEKRTWRYVYRRGLPQSKALGLKDAFFINVQLYFNYSLNQSKLASLFDQCCKRTSWADLEPYLARRLNYFLNRKVTEFYPNDRALPGLKNRLEQYLTGVGKAELKASLAPHGVVVENVILESVYVPNPVQYRAITARSGEFIARELERIKKIDEARTREYAARILDRAYFSRLEGIGKLLRKYPQLREYLAIDRLGGNVDVVVMPYDRYFGSSKSTPRKSPRQPRVLDRILRKRDAREPGKARGGPANGNGYRNTPFNGNRNGSRNSNRNSSGTRNRGNNGFVDLTPP